MQKSDIIKEVEAVSAETGLAPSTIGKLIGQGGNFYDRLQSPARMWPETMAQIKERLDQLRKERKRA